MPKELKIKRESLAKRCEICHQSDQFDPATNRCSRCELVPLNPDQSGSESELNPQDFKKWATGCAPILISGVTAILFNFGLAFVLFLLFEMFGSVGEGSLMFFVVGFVVTFIGMFVAMGLGEYGAMRAQAKAKARNLVVTRKESFQSIIFWTALVNLGIWLLLLSTCGGIICSISPHQIWSLRGGKVGFRPDGRWKIAGVEACFEAHPPESRPRQVCARMGAGSKSQRACKIEDI